tara:strand:- start:387 stop:590 length:204 start_codon:yes stop_codon:yes gene_type:complete
MRVVSTFYMDKEEDGYEGVITYERDDVNDIYTLLQYYGDQTRGIGFTYVEDIAASNTDGTMTWGEKI